MKVLFRILCAIPGLSVLGYLFYLAYTGQWIYFFIVAIGPAWLAALVLLHNPWKDKS